MVRRTLSVIPALAAALVATAPAPASAATLRPEESKVRALVRDVRERRGRDGLLVQAKLSRIARRHSRTMARENELFHRADLTAGLAGVTWHMVGENVGYGSGIRQVHQAFMKSPPHRRNILNRSFDRIGIGVADRHGRSWVTLVFLG